MILEFCPEYGAIRASVEVPNTDVLSKLEEADLVRYDGVDYTYSMTFYDKGRETYVRRYVETTTFDLSKALESEDNGNS